MDWFKILIWFLFIVLVCSINWVVGIILIVITAILLASIFLDY